VKRTLSLKRESLAELSTDALREVVGGSATCLDTLSQKLGCVGTYQCPTWTC